MKDLGVDAGWGEAAYSTTERRWARPTCDVNGIFGGYMGEGPKTIIPAKATAKITCRLVPSQDPEKITRALRGFLASQSLPGLKMDFVDYHGGWPLVFDTSTPYMAAASAAIQRAFGAAPVFIREGGSIPIVSTFREVLGVDTLLLGWGQNTDNLHSPNERFSLDDFHKGTAASAALWWELSKLNASGKKH
jgi:acetylornithine deacetylase/succinyl-diaminopimelate desuccinylase-like protein